ncbi:hypothetical protein SDC9_66485 [bioreactor metagenome]|uniref:Uncharacterized protein n=1 Tax=bioreactor metagenome TaxID=1076179 RepID=A0A644XW97_9ZZZZ
MLGLPWDLVALGQVPQQFEEGSVIDGTAVHKGDHRAFSRRTDLFVFVHRWVIRRRSPFQHQGDFRRHRKGRSEGPPGAYLFLHREGKGAVDGQVFF